MKTVYNKSNGFPELAPENPKRPGEFIFPGNTIEIVPPSFNSETQFCVFTEGEWVVSDIIIPEPEPPMPPPPLEPPPEPERPDVEPIPAINQLRFYRNALLDETDYITLRAYSRGEAVPQEWADYMQALRDLPETAQPELDEDGELTNVAWPTKPE